MLLCEQIHLQTQIQPASKTFYEKHFNNFIKLKTRPSMSENIRHTGELYGSVRKHQTQFNFELQPAYLVAKRLQAP